MGNESIFGYGSLILPTSLIGRFKEIETPLSEIYSKELEESDYDELIRDEAIEKWEQLKETLTIIPVKVYGFERYYSVESDRGGTMLEARYTGDSSDFINGVIVQNLTEEQRASVDSMSSEALRGVGKVTH